MTRREVFMVDSPDIFVQHRAQKLAEIAPGDALAAYQAHLYLAIAMYSRGDSLADVRQQLQAAIQCLEQDSQETATRFALTDPAGYCMALWGLSLAILLDTPTQEFHRRASGQDRLLDHLLKLTGALVHPVDTVLHPSTYLPLVSVIQQDGQRGELIAEFLRQWYEFLGETPWHELHLTQDPAFIGYWSFELAAVVKALHISDQAFASNIFYPRDLVHQREYRHWGATPDGDASPTAEEVRAGEAALDDVKQLLGFVFGTAEAPADTTQADRSFSSLANLFGLNPAVLQDNPEAMQATLLRLLKSVLPIVRQTLSLADGTGQSESDQALRQALKATEQRLQQAASQDLDSVLANLSPADRAQLLEGGGMELSAAARARLTALDAGLAALVADPGVGLEGIFAGMEGIMQRLGPEFGIAPAKPYEVDPNLGDEIKGRIDNALKGTSFDKDFDWSTFLRKD
jgi:hypothetical protein